MAAAFATLFCAPHRPLFLLAGLWAVLVPGVWFWPGVVADPVFWHWHELVFGMAGAAAGGYLLTAVVHWTGQRTGAAATAALVFAWILGRGVILAAAPGSTPAMAAALAYPLTLAALLLRPILAAQAWGRLPLAAVPLALAGAEIAAQRAPAAGGGLPLLSVLVFALLIGGIGGRAVPAFGRSRLGPSAGVSEGRAAGHVATAAVACALPLLATGGAEAVAGSALIVAGLAQTARLVLWRSLSLARHGDVMLLHVAWFWLGFGLMATGFAHVWPGRLDPKTALHALTMGAMGTMIFALAARPVMARVPGRLIAGRALGSAFAVLCAAAVLRLALPGATVLGLAGQQWSALAWSSGWAVFLARGLQGLRQPPPLPALSARRSAVPVGTDDLGPAQRRVDATQDGGDPVG